MEQTAEHRISKMMDWLARYSYTLMCIGWQRTAERTPILGRYACLGADVLKLLQPPHKIINVQKGRVDYLADCWNNPDLRARSVQVAPHISRKGIISLVMQNELAYEWLLPKAPKALFMDSMAELGDQVFVHQKQGWRFLCAYTDLADSVAFQKTYRSEDLLPIADLDFHFRRFFTGIRSRFGNVPIFYLHFPATLESRENFRVRHFAIRESIGRMAQEFPPVYSLAVDDSIVDRDEDAAAESRDFPYHYNHETYETFAQMVRETGVLDLD